MDATTALRSQHFPLLGLIGVAKPPAAFAIQPSASQKPGRGANHTLTPPDAPSFPDLPNNHHRERIAVVRP